jgi:hypothetical protein
MNRRAVQTPPVREGLRVGSPAARQTPGNPRSSDGLRTIDFVVLALANLGGETHPVDIEDVAFEAHRLAPHRFGWRRYPEQIDLAGVRDGLSDSRKPENGGLTVGGRKQGWALTPAGAKLAAGVRDRVANIGSLPHLRLDPAVRVAERRRVLGSKALQKLRSNEADQISPQDVRELLRVDPYVTPEKYGQRLAIVLNAFADEPDIREAIDDMAKRYGLGELAR